MPSVRSIVAAPSPWSSGQPPRTDLPDGLFTTSVVEAARRLLGCRLRSTVGGMPVEGVIVETEAYGDREDPASHAATTSGVTDRNRAMFGPSGSAYVYRSYGVHWCFNVVTGDEGEASAVLVRGLEPLHGVEVMRRRRRRSPIAAGPGRLCQALGITDALYGHDLREEPLRLLGGWAVPDALVGVSGRVGVSRAAQRPFRFYVRGSSGVSRPDGWGATPPGRAGPARESPTESSA